MEPGYDLNYFPSTRKSIFGLSVTELLKHMNNATVVHFELLMMKPACKSLELGGGVERGFCLTQGLELDLECI